MYLLNIHFQLRAAPSPLGDVCVCLCVCLGPSGELSRDLGFRIKTQW